MEQLIDKIVKAPLPAKIGGILALIAVLGALNFFLMIQPIETDIEAEVHKQSELNRQLAEKQEIAQNLNDRRREMDLLEQHLAEALTELPERRDIEELLAQLNDIGRKSGLNIAHVEPGQESPQAFFARIPIRMQVTGNYHEIAMFLQEISTMRRIVNVNNLRLSSNVNSAADQKVILSSEFLATTFRFVDQGKQ